MNAKNVKNSKSAKNAKNLNNRDILAYLTLGLTVSAIGLLTFFIVWKDPSQAKDILNVILPVFASWVGTILAFYFGRENFESANQQLQENYESTNQQLQENFKSANQQVQKLIQKLTPEELAKKPVSEIMRKSNDMTVFKIEPGQREQDLKISALLNKFGDRISRLPIVSAEGKPMYMIHQSKLHQYLVEGGTEDNSLENLISAQQFNFGLNHGFVVVSEKTSLSEAKSKMEGVPSCQDIFITKEGNPDAPISGWLSNIRMAKFLES